MNTKYWRKGTIITVVLMAMVLGGCKKYLDQQPVTEQMPEDVFTSVQGAYKSLIGAYARLVGDNGYGIRLSMYFTVDNDEMQGPTGNVGTSDNDRRDIARYQASSSNAQLSGPFNQLFQGIEFANVCIENIPRMALYNNGTDQEKKQLRRMYGEALTLRAQFYFEAIRNWGDLPEHFESAAISSLKNPFPSRVDRDTLYNHIIADLKTAEDLVPWRTEVTAIGDQINERITKGTVKGLRARIALFRGGYSLRQSGSMARSTDYLSFYQVARDECNEIITSAQHSLNPSYKSLWKDQVCAHAIADPNGELMFQASGFGLSGSEDSKLGYYNGPTVAGNGNKALNILPSYFYLFDSLDLRRDVTCAPYIVNTDGLTKAGQVITSINDGKYRRDWITNPSFLPSDKGQYFGLKWQILRYSDVLLMFAEAENEINGPTAAAYDAVNMVRRRGFGKPITTPDATVDLPAGLGKSEFFKAIVRERALELGSEGVRKYDLIRWNLLGTALSESKANMLKLSAYTATVANNVPMVNPSYMAGYPSYVLTPNLPVSMFYINNSTADDKALWKNSFYLPAPTSTPSGTTKVTWLGTAINTTAVARYALGFTPNHSELLPIPQAARDANFNLTQNP